MRGCRITGGGKQGGQRRDDTGTRWRTEHPGKRVTGRDVFGDCAAVIPTGNPNDAGTGQSGCQAAGICHSPGFSSELAVIIGVCVLNFVECDDAVALIVDCNNRLVIPDAVAIGITPSECVGQITVGCGNGVSGGYRQRERLGTDGAFGVSGTDSDDIRTGVAVAHLAAKAQVTGVYLQPGAAVERKGLPITGCADGVA